MIDSHDPVPTHEPLKCDCEECNWPTHYNYEFDASFCPDCDVWLEGTCDDPECEYCVGRPEKPSQTKQGLKK